MDKQREMFEAWWQESRPSCWVTDWYANMLQDMAWRAWQAALAAQPAVTDGYKLVPIKPTEEMIDAGAEGDGKFYDHAHFVYSAMLAAAP